MTSCAPTQVDLAVVGAGIVGLATAMRWQELNPNAKTVVLEAEPGIAQHQSGHNSGVLHSGVYYRPGSEKAILCRRGKTLMEAFCTENNIAYDRCGKVIVATKASELSRLDHLCERAIQNGVAFERFNTDQLRQREPFAGGIAAMLIPETGIVDYKKVCQKISDHISQRGGSVLTRCQVSGIIYNEDSVELVYNNDQGRDGPERLTCRSVIFCGGLHSDRLYRLACNASGTELPDQPRIVPFRGEYFRLKPDRRHLCNHLIYPVPDPEFPFLGVHFTRMMDGEVECGPNAVWAFSRLGYRARDISLRDMVDTLSFSGFRRLAARHWRMGLGEMHRSLRKKAYVRELQKLIPTIRGDDILPAVAGVRAQAVTPDGDLVDDFVFASLKNTTHVINAPSPAATASLAIAERICEQHSQLLSDQS